MCRVPGSNDVGRGGNQPLRLALRPREAAEALGVSERTLRAWMRDEGLPFARVGRSVLIPHKDLEHWIEQRVGTSERVSEIVDDILGDL